MDEKTAPLRQIGMLRHLSVDSWALLEPQFKQMRHFNAGEVITERFVSLSHSLLLLDGLVGRRVPVGICDAPRLHLVALQVPGDFVDLHAYPLKVLDHDVVAVTDAQVAIISHEALAKVLSNQSELTRQLWSLTLVDAAIHRHWSLRNGTMRALQRIANLFAELVARLDQGRGSPAGTYCLNLTQSQIGDACGLSGVHVNRVMRELREAGCCTYQRGKLTIKDMAALNRIADFDPYYLYLPKS